MQSVFDQDLFHMGGDEVNLNCWETPQIREFLEKENITDFNKLWIHFQTAGSNERNLYIVHISYLLSSNFKF